MEIKSLKPRNLHKKSIGTNLHATSEGDGLHLHRHHETRAGNSAPYEILAVVRIDSVGTAAGGAGAAPLAPPREAPTRTSSALVPWTHGA